mgnify:CR=1 FL=1
MRTPKKPILIFQSTLPRRERQILHGIYVPAYLFQSTLPRRERRIYKIGYGFRYDFNPRSREGSDVYTAPSNANGRNHFNPRSREGSDRGLWSYRSHIWNFNPRSREGSDQRKPARTTGSSVISIHAPAKGATVEKEILFLFLTNFNPRSREGSDAFNIFSLPDINSFQSTLPRRERPTYIPRPAYLSNFNPRSREGSDPIAQPVKKALFISIHAPAKGATRKG